MKPANKLTLRFLWYFTLFYILIIVGFILSLLFFILFINERIGNNIHTMLPSEITDTDIKKENEQYVIAPQLVKRAKENGGMLYVLNQSLDVLTYTGKNCELCKLPRKERLGFKREGMQLWKTPDYYVLFVPMSPTEPLFQEIEAMWRKDGQLSAALKQKVIAAQATVEIYNPNWQRDVVLGKQLRLLEPAELLSDTYDIFEHEELFAHKVLKDGSTLVLRMPNASYKPFDEPFEKGLLVFLITLLGFHVILLIGVSILSIGISRQFVRPIVYVIARIERLTKFNYEKVFDKNMHHAKTSKLKRKYKLFQPVDESITDLANRLQHNEKQIQRTEQLREEWITGLSHDLKTPLSSIYGYSTMLASDYQWSTEEIRAFAQTMQDKATYMDALIQDLTYTYQLKNNAIALEPSLISLHDWLPQFADQQVNIHVYGQVVLYADELLLKRALDNLIGNAKKYTPEQTKVCIEAQNIPQGVMITITDKGTGIPAETLDNLFERYYRGTNTTDEVTGTGLGLAITKQLIDLHQASIDVQSDENGTIFMLKFPQ